MVGVQRDSTKSWLFVIKSVAMVPSSTEFGNQ